MNAIFFATQFDFRKWLQKNHRKETEIVVGFYKVDSGKPSITWPQSVDEALCFGWIDGIRKSIDGESYCIRFTPRRPGSTWSAINIKKAEALIQQGLMQPAGLELFSTRVIDKTRLYSYENKPQQLPAGLEKKLKANKIAWQFFFSQSASYQRTVYFWILSARQDKTQLNRLEKLIAASEGQKKLF
jgi:Uncharacterized protein conserved in bacteria